MASVTGRITAVVHGELHSESLLLMLRAGMTVEELLTKVLERSEVIRGYDITHCMICLASKDGPRLHPADDVSEVLRDSDAVHVMVRTPDNEIPSRHGTLSTSREPSSREGRTRALWQESATTAKPLLDCAAVLTGHADEVCTAAFLDTGLLASGSYDGTAAVWDVSARRRVAAMEAGSPVTSVAGLPNDAVLFAAGEELVVWEPTSGRRLQTLSNPKAPLTCTAPLGGGLAAVGDEAGALRVWDLAVGRCAQELDGHKDEICHLATLPAAGREGRRLASASADGTVRIWDLASGAEATRTLRAGGGAVYGVAALPEGAGRLASGSLDGVARIWDLAANQEPTGTYDAGAAIYAVAALPGGVLALGTFGTELRLWRYAAETQGAVATSLEGHGRAVRCLATGGGAGILASGSSDTSLRLWTAPGQGT